MTLIMFSRLPFDVTAVWIVTASLLICSLVQCEEYCEYETFAPSCASDEVIMIMEAFYGRMKTGKCIPDTYYADLGCSTNVQAVLTQQCSGRQSCSYRIHNLVLDHLGNCPPSATRSYLEVTFTCLRVYTPATNCEASMSIPITNIGTEGYIASYITQKTNCGNYDNPWLLTVDEGQRINITLIDFTSGNINKNEYTDNRCIVYAIIRDGKGVVRNVICGGQQKISPVFMSTSNSVEIQLVGKANQQQKPEQSFLLKYSIEGCSDPDLPETMWVKRFLYEALVGCKAGQQTTWLLKCTKGVWEGQVGICSPVAASAPVLAQPKAKDYSADVASYKPNLDSNYFTDNSEEWYIVLFRDKNLIIIAGTFVFVCILFFALGLICIWSKYAKKETQPPLQVDHLTYGCKDYSYSRPLPPSYNLHTSARNPMPPTALQSATYAFSDTSSTYNTVSQQCLSTRDHIYESTFSPNIIAEKDVAGCEDAISEHTYFVLDPNCVPNK